MAEREDGRLCLRRTWATHLSPAHIHLPAADSGIGIDNTAPAAPAPIHSIVPECPEALDTLILRLLAKDRELPPTAWKMQFRICKRSCSVCGLSGPTEMAERFRCSSRRARRSRRGRRLRPFSIWTRSRPRAVSGASTWLRSKAPKQAPSDAAAAMPAGCGRAREVGLGTVSARRRQATGSPLRRRARRAASGRRAFPPTQRAATIRRERGTEDSRPSSPPSRRRPGSIQDRPRAGWSAEERARMALARHSAENELWLMRELRQARSRAPGALRRTLAFSRFRPGGAVGALGPGASGILCLTLLYIAWSLRPVRIAPAPRQLEFHQMYGRLPEARQVELGGS